MGLISIPATGPSFIAAGEIRCQAPVSPTTVIITCENHPAGTQVPDTEFGCQNIPGLHMLTALEVSKRRPFESLGDCHEKRNAAVTNRRLRRICGGTDAITRGVDRESNVAGRRGHGRGP